MLTATSSGSPVSPWREVYVGGSLGRDETAAMIAAMLRASGATAGFLAGSFLQSPLERLQVDGVPIDSDEAMRHVAGLSPTSDTGSPLDRIAELWFERAGATWAVRSTPAPSPRADAVVWTSIVGSGGGSAAEAARHLVTDAPAARVFVAAPQRESVLDVLRASYPELCEVAKLCAMSRGRAGLDGQDLRLRTPKREYGLKLPLLGRQQLENAATAILAVEQLASAGVMLTADAAHTALSSLRLPGRIEPVKRRPLILVDIAEAPEAMRRLVDTLQNDLGLRRPLVILAAMRQADFPALAAPLAVLDPNLILARAPDGGMAEPMNLAQACLDAGLPMPRVEDLTAAVDEALAANPSESACIAGPRAFVATARAYILGLMPPNIHLV